MSAREKQIKENLDAALKMARKTVLALEEADCPELANEVDELHRRVLRLRSTMVYPCEQKVKSQAEKRDGIATKALEE